MSRENVEAVRQAHAAFNRADYGPMRDLTADHVEWGTTGTWPGIDPVYKGPDAIVRWADDVRSAWESFEVAIDDVLAETADSVLLVERLTGRGFGSGVDVESRVFSVYRFEDGKIVRREAFTDKLPALKAVEPRE